MPDPYHRDALLESISQEMSVEDLTKSIPALKGLLECETYADLVHLEQSITPENHMEFYKNVQIKYYKQRLVIKIQGHPLKTIDLPSI